MTFAEHEVLSRVLNDQELHLTTFDSSERSWWVRDDRLRAALRDEDPRRAIADRLLAICEEPNTEQRYSIGAAAWNDHNDGEAAGEAACAALLALAKGTAP
jgi:hypothetical protein